MELGSTVFLGKVGPEPCIKLKLILLRNFQLGNEEWFSAEHRMELLLTARFIFASDFIIHSISFLVRHFPNQLGKLTALILGFELIRVIIDALQQDSHFFAAGHGQLVQSCFQRITRGLLHAG